MQPLQRRGLASLLLLGHAHLLGSLVRRALHRLGGLAGLLRDGLRRYASDGEQRWRRPCHVHAPRPCPAPSRPPARSRSALTASRARRCARRPAPPAPNKERSAPERRASLAVARARVGARAASRADREHVSHAALTLPRVDARREAQASCLLTMAGNRCKAWARARTSSSFTLACSDGVERPDMIGCLCDGVSGELEGATDGRSLVSTIAWARRQRMQLSQHVPIPTPCNSAAPVLPARTRRCYGSMQASRETAALPGVPPATGCNVHGLALCAPAVRANPHRPTEATPA